MFLDGSNGSDPNFYLPSDKDFTDGELLLGESEAFDKVELSDGSS